MPAFLVITSLSLSFYLGLLVFLYRDSGKRRSRGGSLYKVETEVVSELEQRLAMVKAAPSRRRQNAAVVLVRLGANSGHSELRSRVSQVETTKVITLPALARDNKDAQCG